MKDSPAVQIFFAISLASKESLSYQYDLSWNALVCLLWHDLKWAKHWVQYHTETSKICGWLTICNSVNCKSNKVKANFMLQTTVLKVIFT